MIADPHDIRKSGIEDEMIADSEDRDELAKAAYEAFWNYWVSQGFAKIIIPWDEITPGQRLAWAKVAYAVIKKFKS